LKDTYKTVEKMAAGLYKEKGSRFISSVHPVTSEEEIKQILAEIKTRYFDARHHCYAWILGTNGEDFRANDDGEPSSTAGKPILGQLLSRELTNILLVVVRYFGGTKLGTSGLAQAYRAAAADALDHAVIIEKNEEATLRVTFNYLVMNDVMKVLKEESPRVEERDFALACRVVLRVRRSLLDRLRARLQGIESVQVSVDGMPDE
jgi:uncharacterized YigZ family protein